MLHIDITLTLTLIGGSSMLHPSDCPRLVQHYSEHGSPGNRANGGVS